MAAGEGCDLAVVGGGLVGLATAWAAVTEGASVTLIDSNDPGRATDAGAGILSPETHGLDDAESFHFARAAREYYRTLVPALEAAGNPETGYAECGSISLSVDPGEDRWFAPFADLVLGRAPDVLTEIAPDEARERFPLLGPVHRAIFNPTAARVDGRALAGALRRAAAAAGLVVLDGRATGLATEGRRVRAVAVGGTEVACGAVVIAGGAWSGSFAERLDAPIPVAPTKGQIIHLRVPGEPGAGSGSWPIIQPVLTHYLVSWPGGRVACGGTFEPGAGFDARPTAAGVGQLLREAVKVAPGLADATFGEVRVGLRPTAVDGRPVLGALPGWENVHLATGHGAEGLLLGPYSGALVARGALGTAAPAGLSPFDPARFS